MMSYAFIKDSVVINVLVFDETTDEILKNFCVTHGADAAVPCEDRTAYIGGLWDGTDFISASPYPSWVLNSQKKWTAPIPYPSNEDGVVYTWDEQSVSWKKLDA